MKYLIFQILFFSQCFFAGAQSYERKIIHSTDNFSDFVTWQFPSFEDAIVRFRNGGTLATKMNFNRLFCSMQFINPKGDTLEIAKPDDIDSIRFSHSTFFYKNSYFEVIGAAGPVKLIVSRKVSIAFVKLGAMGLPARNVSTGDYVDYTVSMKLLEIHADQDIYVNEKTEYFLSNKGGELMKAGKSNFLDVFYSDKNSIEKYLKSNKINFNKQNDLEKLFQFCTHT